MSQFHPPKDIGSAVAEGTGEPHATEYARMKNRAMLSPAQTRQIVLERYLDGHQPYDIANRLGILVSEVRMLLAAEGIEAPPPVPARPVHPMWDHDEDKRREAIIRRAAKGARETLAMHRRQITFSTDASATHQRAQFTEESLE